MTSRHRHIQSCVYATNRDLYNFLDVMVAVSLWVFILIFMCTMSTTFPKEHFMDLGHLPHVTVGIWKTVNSVL